MAIFTQPSKPKPSSIIISKILKYRIDGMKRHLPRDPFVYYVTDLVRCSMKRQFEINHPELLYIRATSGRTFLGDMVHRGLESLLKDLFGDSLKIEHDTDFTDRSKEIIIDNVKYVVKGRIDAILNGDTGIEIKETVSRGPLPYQHHVEQAMIYNWLYGFKKTLLFYVSPDGIYEFEVVDSFSDDEIIKRIREPKAPRWDWECDSCEFRTVCPIARLQSNRRK